MEIVPKQQVNTCSTQRRQWRRSLKKEQRRKRRQKAAMERDKTLKEEEEAKLNDPDYQKWLTQQSELDVCQRLAEEQKHLEDEEAWLRRELIAQKEFRIRKLQREAEDAAQALIREQQEKELEEREAAKRKRREEKERQKAEAIAEFERTMQRMEEYLNGSGTTPPHELQRFVESRPGAKLCVFYERTNCCRFGPSCVYNHRRPLLSRIVLVHHFFSHPLLQRHVHNEYSSADAMLEMSESDLRADYNDFFNDVVPEMERFGQMYNFRTARNVQAHLRGHVFIEYTEEKSALKAFINLQGRYYATKRLNVEFSNIKKWRDAICGLFATHKCPKGDSCNYLHLLKNPENKYNAALESFGNWTSTNSIKRTPCDGVYATPLLSWNDVGSMTGIERARNWRWSESPEIELTQKVETTELTEQNNYDKKIAKSTKSPRKKHRRKHSRHKSKRNRKDIKHDSDCKSKRDTLKSSPYKDNRSRSGSHHSEESSNHSNSGEQLSSEPKHRRSRSKNWKSKKRKRSRSRNRRSNSHNKKHLHSKS